MILAFPSNVTSGLFQACPPLSWLLQNCCRACNQDEHILHHSKSLLAQLPSHPSEKLVHPQSLPLHVLRNVCRNICMAYRHLIFKSCHPGFSTTEEAVLHRTVAFIHFFKAVVSFGKRIIHFVQISVLDLNNSEDGKTAKIGSEVVSRFYSGRKRQCPDNPTEATIGNLCPRSRKPSTKIGCTGQDCPTVEKQAERFKELKLNDQVYEIVKQEDPDLEVVFFHGLLLPKSDPDHAFWRTWNMRRTEEFWPETLLPQLLPKNCKLRVLCISYPAEAKFSEIGNDGNDEYIISENLRTDLIQLARVGQRDNVPVFLVGHDLGGILIKHFVMSVEKSFAQEADVTRKEELGRFLENLNAVFFFATPHSGSDAFQNMASKIQENEQHQMLRFMSVLNNHQSRINAEFTQYRSKRQKRFTAHAIHPTHATNQGGFKGVVVPEGSARNDVDFFHSVAADHFQVCQPEDATSNSVITVQNTMEEALEQCQEKKEKTQQEQLKILSSGRKNRPQDSDRMHESIRSKE